MLEKQILFYSNALTTLICCLFSDLKEMQVATGGLLLKNRSYKFTKFQEISYGGASV